MFNIFKRQKVHKIMYMEYSDDLAQKYRVKEAIDKISRYHVYNREGIVNLFLDHNIIVGIDEFPQEEKNRKVLHHLCIPLYF